VDFPFGNEQALKARLAHGERLILGRVRPKLGKNKNPIIRVCSSETLFSVKNVRIIRYWSY
jgi:hypothetical protein